jgi:hypothetical protein
MSGPIQARDIIRALVCNGPLELSRGSVTAYARENSRIGDLVAWSVIGTRQEGTAARSRIDCSPCRASGRHERQSRHQRYDRMGLACSVGEGRTGASRGRRLTRRPKPSLPSPEPVSRPIPGRLPAGRPAAAPAGGQPFSRIQRASTSLVEATNETECQSTRPLCMRCRCSIHCKRSAASAHLPETANCLSGMGCALSVCAREDLRALATQHFPKFHSHRRLPCG